MSNKQFRGTCG